MTSKYLFPLITTILLAQVFSLAGALAPADLVLDFEKDVGGIPDDESIETLYTNTGLMNTTLVKLQQGGTLIIPNKTFNFMGGIYAVGLDSVVFQIDGTMKFPGKIDDWPEDATGHHFHCMNFYNITNFTFTSSGIGTIDGAGQQWWGFPFIGYLDHGKGRPKMLYTQGGVNLLVENLLMINPPVNTFWAKEVDGLEIRNCEIDARRSDLDSHNDYDLSAFNTDGFDVTGKNVWIHDSRVWNQDDCIGVKDGSENFLIERVNASGLGLTIGSIGGSVVKNITFRDCYMHHTYKGIYLKFRDSETPGYIEDILYENILMDEPEQWPIWIGPAQQSDTDNLCAAHPCSLCWPEVPGQACHLPATGLYKNITMKNITIVNPKKERVGVIMANETNPIQGITFDNVKVEGDKKYSWFRCENVLNGVTLGDTYPIPDCFNKDVESIKFLEY